MGGGKGKGEGGWGEYDPFLLSSFPSPLDGGY